MPESLRGRIGADDAARAFARRTPAGSSRRGFCAQVGLAVLGLAVGLPESAAVADMPAKLPLPAGFRYPNGVAAAPDGTLFVGSVVGGQVLRRAPGFDRWDTLFAGSEAIFASTTLRLDVDRNLLWGLRRISSGRGSRTERRGGVLIGSTAWMPARAPCAACS
jgi:hypothetical protein